MPGRGISRRAQTTVVPGARAGADEAAEAGAGAEGGEGADAVPVAVAAGGAEAEADADSAGEGAGDRRHVHPDAATATARVVRTTQEGRGLRMGASGSGPFEHAEPDALGEGAPRDLA